MIKKEALRAARDVKGLLRDLGLGFLDLGGTPSVMYVEQFGKLVVLVQKSEWGKDSDDPFYTWS